MGAESLDAIRCGLASPVSWMILPWAWREKAQNKKKREGEKMTRAEIAKFVREHKSAFFMKAESRYNCWIYRNEDGTFWDAKKMGIECYWDGTEPEPVIIGCYTDIYDMDHLITEIEEQMKEIESKGEEK